MKKRKSTEQTLGKPDGGKKSGGKTLKETGQEYHSPVNIRALSNHA